MLPSFSPVPNAPFSMSQPSPKPFILTDGWGLLTTKLPLSVLVRYSRKRPHQYVWVPSPSLAGSIVSFADCSEVMGHVTHSGQWCVGVKRCINATPGSSSPYHDLRQSGLQTEWRGSVGKLQGSGWWKDPASLYHMVGGSPSYNHLTMLWAINMYSVDLQGCALFITAVNLQWNWV